ncbi:thiol reductant ABC exporter subunit CydC [Actinocatenispora comari]|uniref:thiol reductant ABC exporter subunit CydC n=1 Tax=Actinocatenispora comari TaxID=2807577 RepID=UPI001A92DE8A|nr:thiol reductant ABC exporter subunit CydC [Actinocatenispora comari]
MTGSVVGQGKSAGGVLRAVWWPVALAAAAGAGAELAGTALLATAAWLLARAAQQPGLAALAVAIVAVRAFALLRGTLRYAERLTGHRAALRALARLRERVYAALVPLAPGGLPGWRRAQLLHRMVTDTEAVQDLVVRCLVPAAGAALAGGLGLVVLAALSPSSVPPLLAALVGTGLVLPACAGRHRRRTAGADDTAVAVTATDLLDGAAELAAYGAEPAALAAADAAHADRAGRERTEARVAGLLTAVGIALQGLAAASATVLATRAGGPAVAVVALTTLVALEPSLALPVAARRLVDARAALRRVRAVLAAPAPVAEPATPLPVPAGPVEITIRDLRVRYADDRAPALDGVSVDVRPGSRLVVTGPSGSGKSTLLAALRRFVAPAAGTIRLDGTPLDAYAGVDVRRLIGGVGEEAYLFDTTLAANLRLGDPDATDDQLRAVLRRVGLGDRFAGELATELGQDGSTLSGGERQRVLLARALLADPQVLLLDEPTEGLPAADADRLLRDLLTATAGRTTILVSHDPAARAHADQLLDLGAAVGPRQISRSCRGAAS